MPCDFWLLRDAGNLSRANTGLDVICLGLNYILSVSTGLFYPIHSLAKVTAPTSALVDRAVGRSHVV
jgi:hypothetical protein